MQYFCMRIFYTSILIVYSIQFVTGFSEQHCCVVHNDLMSVGGCTVSTSSLRPRPRRHSAACASCAGAGSSWSAAIPARRAPRSAPGLATCWHRASTRASHKRFLYDIVLNVVLTKSDQTRFVMTMSCMLISKLIISLQAELRLFLRQMPYPGSGRKIPTLWHGAGAYPGVFIP